MKVVTVLGTRPEIIRLSRVIARLDGLCEHRVVFTGQNFDPALSDVFFADLGVRAPDVSLGIRGDTAGERIGAILAGCEAVFAAERPDRLLVLGDTDSALCAFMAKRMGIPVLHMEAGNRCYDDRVPEEVNRRLIDHASDVLMPYTERSRQNLLDESIPGRRIFVTGNPIHEVIEHHAAATAQSDALARLGVEPGGYVLVTFHRAENVDDPVRLASLLGGLRAVAARLALPVICSTHPRTRAKAEAAGIALDGPGLRFLPPLRFFDFVHLERHAKLVMSDSGTVQEECAIFGVPQVTLRDTTERPEIREFGGSILSGVEAGAIEQAAVAALALGASPSVPPEYLRPDVSSIVARLVLSSDL
ncbi:non-hydrolyzing UDP-N-acetylglucosamine 2-epimerase [Arenibaculum pallidiluteum]|uniref:non-hydrolyzing UDP-N-acetylglucosamine 2-epimerase n=1 Tax=Arenibaculum pallidiluteum TaxID=2812559 RepID=UPI001A95A3A4|nr:UDP-N-acetylglucosamine 2-epimerase (non-hydrolyzing) [Arenibaculum pallidiluteum]